jgi:hypothetical protein
MKRAALLTSILLILPTIPLSASPIETVSVAAIIDQNGLLQLKRFDVPAISSNLFLSRLDATSPVLASGIINRRHTLADPRRSEQWGLSRLDVEKVRELGTGSGIIVAVIDTGVQGDHPEFGNRVLPGLDLVDKLGDGRSDPNGHGTHVAGIIAAAINGFGTEGLAPNASILPVRVLGPDGSGDDADVAFGILWAMRNGAQIINLSLGGEEVDPLLADAVEQANSAGVLVVVAAGNGGPDSKPMYPAAHQSVLAVASTGPDDSVSLFSSRGLYVDIAAPGSMILSSVPGGYRYESGTSMAAPFVSAAAAILLGRGLSISEIRSRLVSSAHDVGQLGLDADTGSGVVDIVAAASGPTPRIEQPSALPPSIIPALPKQYLPDLKMPLLPDLYNFPVLQPNPGLPSLPKTPSLPIPPKSPVLDSPSMEIPKTDPLPKIRTTELIPTKLTAVMSVIGESRKINISLRTDRVGLAFRLVSVSVSGGAKSITYKVRTDMNGNAVLTIPYNGKKIYALWTGDNVTAPANISVKTR